MIDRRLSWAVTLPLLIGCSGSHTLADAGMQAVDAGPSAIDAGVPLVDGGLPARDASELPDAGVLPACDGVHAGDRRTCSGPASEGSICASSGATCQRTICCNGSVDADCVCRCGTGPGCTFGECCLGEPTTENPDVLECREIAFCRRMPFG